MPQFIEDFLYGAKIASEYIALMLAAILIIGSCFGIAIGIIFVADYIANNNPLLFFIVLPIELILVGGFGYAFYKLSIRKWSEFCKRKKQRKQLSTQKQKFQRMSKSIEQR